MIFATAHKFGDNIDTDVIIPARYLNASDREELAKHCMEDIDSTFAQRIKSGDIIVGGKNFGCGSSREHAPIAISGAGISLVIAESFARIFFRNAINTGLAILECEEAAQKISDDDMLIVDTENGIIENTTKGETYHAAPFPLFISDIIKDGGLIEHIKGEK